jgi:hypothetical protein
MILGFRNSNFNVKEKAAQGAAFDEHFVENLKFNFQRFA